MQYEIYPIHVYAISCIIVESFLCFHICCRFYYNEHFWKNFRFYIRRAIVAKEIWLMSYFHVSCIQFLPSITAIFAFIWEFQVFLLLFLLVLVSLSISVHFFAFSFSLVWPPAPTFSFSLLCISTFFSPILVFRSASHWVSCFTYK